MATRISVKEASRILQVNEAAIRRGLRQGELPIGAVVTNEKEMTYLIYKEKIDAFLGKDQDKVKVIDEIMKYLVKLKHDYSYESDQDQSEQS